MPRNRDKLALAQFFFFKLSISEMSSEVSLAVAVVCAFFASVVVIVGAIFPFRHDIFRCIGRPSKNKSMYELAEF